MRFAYASIFVAALTIASAPGLDGATWKSNGPAGGTVSALTPAPSNRRVLYAGTAAGFFSSDDGGESWSNAGFSGQPVDHVAVDPIDEHVVYASSGGVYKTTDGGSQWERLGLPAGVLPSAILIDPRNRLTVYAGSACGPIPIVKSRAPQWHQDAGVYKSTDGGSTWTRANEGLEGFQRCVVALTLDPASPDTLYVTPINGDFSDGGYVRSDDGGLSWTRASGKVPGSGAVADPFNPRKRYGITSGSLLVTVDAGATWSEVRPVEISPTGAPQAEIRGTYNTITIDPRTGRLFLGTSKGAYRSGDGGLTWLSLGGAARDSVYSLVFDSTSGVLLTATASGLSRSTTFPWNDWNSLPVGHGAAEIQEIAIDPSRPGTLYALAGNQLYRTRDHGGSWETVGELLPLTDNHVPIGRNLAVDARGDAFVRVFDSGNVDDKLYRVDAGSAQWVEASPPKSPYGDAYGRTLTFVTADPKSPGEVYAGQILQLAHTRDGGETWEQLPTMDTAYSLAIDPSNTAILYAVTPNGILKSTDRGRSWVLKTFEYASLSSAITVSAADPSVLYVATNNRKLAVSTDAGESWTTVPLPGAAISESVVADPRQRLTVYLGTFSSGVFRSTDGGQTWRPLGDGLPRDWVSSLAVDPAGLFLHAGTSLRGVWTQRLTGRPRGVRP